jgi:hypothetical protein
MYLICQKGPLLCRFGSKSVVFEFILVEKPKKQLYLADRGPWASLRASTAKRKTSNNLNSTIMGMIGGTGWGRNSGTDRSGQARADLARHGRNRRNTGGTGGTCTISQTLQQPWQSLHFSMHFHK